MRRRITGHAVLFGLFLSIAISACDTGTEPILPGTVTASAGDQQTAIAGSPVTIAPSVLVKDTKGRPMKGATVTFAVSAGGGTLGTAAPVTTGPDGIAAAGAWTLGNTAGMNTVTASVTGITTPLVFSAIGTAGAPAVVVATSGNSQSATVASSLPVLPTVQVKDAHDNAVSGATVTFEVTSGGGSITGATSTTDANGFAHVGSWTIGTTAGANTLSASVTGIAPAILLATGTPGAANAITLSAIVKPTQVTATVAAPPTVVVRDAFQNPVPGVAVTFSAGPNSGTIAGATQTTDANGSATLGSWTLGTTAGTQNLTASVVGIAPLTIGVNALPAAPSQMSMNGGNNQSGSLNTMLAMPVSVSVRDRFSNPVSGTTVNFTVTSGGGSVSPSSAVTNASGVAAVTWQLGANAGANTLQASLAGIDPVNFTATAINVPPPPPTNPNAFNILVRYVAPPSARQQQAVERAVARWQGIIKADLTDVAVNLPAASCGNSPALNETVDDILIFVDFSPIDGVGRILGQAGPCFIRSTSRLPIMGTMQLDAADLTAMEADGTIDDVVLHEMGHILGFGTLWPDQGLLRNAATDSSTFTGALAGTAFLNSGGVTFPGNPVPVENCVGIAGCGAGTRDAHWREHVMGRELMTGYITSGGGANPLSKITIQSLADLGYTVDVSMADSYTVGLSLRTGEAAEPRTLVEGQPSWKIRTISDRPSKE